MEGSLWKWSNRIDTFSPAVLVLMFKLLDNLDLVAQEPELRPKDPVDGSSTAIQF